MGMYAGAAAATVAVYYTTSKLKKFFTERKKNKYIGEMKTTPTTVEKENGKIAVLMKISLSTLTLANKCTRIKLKIIIGIIHA